MTEATLSSEEPDCDPAGGSQSVGLKPGDKILGGCSWRKVLVLQKPKSYHAAIRGLARGAYPQRLSTKGTTELGSRTAPHLSPASPPDRFGHQYLHLSIGSQPKVPCPTRTTIFSWLERPGSDGGHVHNHHDRTAGPAVPRTRRTTGRRLLRLAFHLPQPGLDCPEPGDRGSRSADSRSSSPAISRCLTGRDRRTLAWRAV